MSELALNKLSTRTNRVHLDGLSSSGILDEKSLLKMLCLEQKRTERSSRRFVLVLIEPGHLLKTGTERFQKKVLDALARSTRETDIKGWDKEGTIIGIIFTEICEVDALVEGDILVNR